MSIRNRLAALESQQVTKSVAKSGATSELMKQLHAVAERIRGTPLCDLTSGASPVTIAALILDGRVDDEVAQRCVELSKQTKHCMRSREAQLMRKAINDHVCAARQLEHLVFGSENGRS
ncbi:hypothetical protein RUM8411_01645 [Ruegeria meonggei]|uniref:Uncharacterized protein n=1 Tax=Ruegeria meonggei TaxID=1446476 RepID=A0A1X6Z242_9RHOB|nr:hypothetical protein RUM8411_01645 [Ruegeria meonggei]